MTKNIVLIGFMGTGKTSVGKILARELQRPLIDIDHRIEELEKRKIGDIFEKEGEVFFRSLEKKAVMEAAARQSVVITTGGGVVLDPDNMTALKKNGYVIALIATPQTIVQRVKDSAHRPLLKGEDLLGRVNDLLEKRKAYYSQADLTMDTDGQTPSQVAVRILKELAS